MATAELSQTAPAPGGPPAMSVRILAILALAFVACFALMAIKIDHAFGLPAHPLLLHIPVVFDPLLALASIALALRPEWRRRYAVLWAGLAIFALAGTVLTASAGDSLYHERPRVDQLLHDHKSAGETLRLLMFFLTAAILVTVTADLLGLGPVLAAVLSVVVIALSAAAGFFTVRAGHLGAKSVWAHEEGPGGFPGGGRFGGGGGRPFP